MTHTEWHTVVTRGGLAAKVVSLILKRESVYIEGRLRTRSWEDKRVTPLFDKVLCDNLEMLGRRKSDQAENTKMAKEPELYTRNWRRPSFLA